MSFEYTLYGLPVRSAMQLPEVSSSKLVADDGRKAVEIEVGRVPSGLKGGQQITPSMEISENACLYRFEGVGSFLIEGGYRIVVDAEPHVASSDVRAFLFGSTMGTLLHQRRLLPLHISAVVSPSAVIAFTGPSGAGKSTTVGMIHRHSGWPILCDDVAVVRMMNDRPVLSSGLIRLKLWKDALERFGIDEEGLDRDFIRHDKFHLSAPRMFARDGRALDKLVVLDWGGQTGSHKLNGADAFVAVARAIYRPYLADMFGDRIELNRVCGAIARATTVVRLTGGRQEISELGGSCDSLFAAMAV